MSIAYDSASVQAYRAVAETYGVEVVEALVDDGFTVSAKLEGHPEVDTKAPAKDKGKAHVQGRLI